MISRFRSRTPRRSRQKPGTKWRNAIPALAMLLALPCSPSDSYGLNYADLSLDELRNTEITSVSHRAECLSAAPGSIFVLTREEIRRSGARTLLEALRLAPSLQLTRSNATGYAITSRGFSNDHDIANRLLVLVDGRTVYSLSRSGVFWDMQDVALEDVEQIEVTSGPAGTLWGANSVNGVINIITRSARATTGTLAAITASERQARPAFRYGAPLGPTGSIRAYAMRDGTGTTWLENGSSAQDGWQRQQFEFRADWAYEGRTLTVQGDTYRESAEALPLDRDLMVADVNLLARWVQELGIGSEVRLQTYYDQTGRDDSLLFRDSTQVVDLALQHAIAFAPHRILGGGGYRYAHFAAKDSVLFSLSPLRINLAWRNVFLQDEFAPTPSLALTVGTTLKRNSYTGCEFLPTARLAWTTSESQLVWGAISWAIRAAARLDRDLHLPPSGLLNYGGPHFESEIATVLKIGYRAQPMKAVTISATTSRHHYDKLRSGHPPPFANIENKTPEKIAGIEASASVEAMRSWRITSRVATLKKSLRFAPYSADPVGTSASGNDPEHQWMLRLAFTLGERHEVDIMVRRVGELPSPSVPAYTSPDARIAWRPNLKVETSATDNNIVGRGHVEFGSPNVRGEFDRRVSI